MDYSRNDSFGSNAIWWNSLVDKTKKGIHDPDLYGFRIRPDFTEDEK